MYLLEEVVEGGGVPPQQGGGRGRGEGEAVQAAQVLGAGAGCNLAGRMEGEGG